MTSAGLALTAFCQGWSGSEDTELSTAHVDLNLQPHLEHSRPELDFVTWDVDSASLSLCSDIMIGCDQVLTCAALGVKCVTDPSEHSACPCLSLDGEVQEENQRSGDSACLNTENDA